MATWRSGLSDLGSMRARLHGCEARPQLWNTLADGGRAAQRGAGYRSDTAVPTYRPGPKPSTVFPV